MRETQRVSEERKKNIKSGQRLYVGVRLEERGRERERERKKERKINSPTVKERSTKR